MAAIKTFFFYPILEEPIRKFGNKGSGSTSYISKTIYEEFIQLLVQKVSAIIFQEIKSAKFYAIILDSTPDKVDLLCLCEKDRTPVERFLMIIENLNIKLKIASCCIFNS